MRSDRRLRLTRASQTRLTTENRALRERLAAREAELRAAHAARRALLALVGGGVR